VTYVIKSYSRKQVWHWARGPSKNLGFPFNISATTEDSDFKFGRQLGFAKGHHKNHTKRKSGRGHGLGELPNVLEFPFNIFATAEASDFKFGMPSGFSKSHHTITRRRNVGVALV